MCDSANRRWWRCFAPEAPLPIRAPKQSVLPASKNDVVFSDCASFSGGVARMVASWLNRGRRRYLLLILCSPILVPLIFAASPVICAVEVWWCARRKRRRREDAVAGGAKEETGLMQRYLEDQLMLVVGSMYDCGDGGDGNVEDEEDWVDVEYLHVAGPIMQ